MTTTGAVSSANSVCVNCGGPATTGIMARLVARVRRTFRPRTPAGGGALLQMSTEEVLAALGPEAPAELRSAIASGCCTHYTVAEGFCGSSGCGEGSCCYHIVSNDCGIDKYACVGFPCSHGNYSTGC